MSVEREFPNPFPDFDQRRDLDASGFERDFLDRLLQTEKRLTKKLDQGLGSSVDASDYSVYTGTCGVALLFWRRSRSSGDGDLLAKSYECVRDALGRRRGKRITFACGDAGPLALGAVVCSEMGKAEKTAKYLHELHDLQGKAVDLSGDMPDEFLYGRAGYLFALLFVRKHLGPSSANTSAIHEVVEAILTSGRRLARRQRSQAPLMYQWHEKHYLGAAHGISGILFQLMQAAAMMPGFGIREKVDVDVKATLDYLLNIRFPSGNFPSSLESDKTDKLVHWCHGAPGVIHAFSLAHQLYGDEKYLAAALRCGDVIWRRGLLRKGYGVCHGVAGNAYAFVRLYDLTKDPRYAYRASAFAKWIFDYGSHDCRIADRPFSLFEGLAGTLYFLHDMMKIGEARFPAFDLLD